MGKKKKTTIFYVGKNIPKTDASTSPIRGVPGTNIDFYKKKSGALHRRRKIGASGVAIKDYDMPDVHKSKTLVHDYKGTVRLGDRKPTKKEWREIRKAAKKRRFW